MKNQLPVYAVTKICQNDRSVSDTAGVTPVPDWTDTSPDSKVHGANMGPTWLLSAPDGPHVGPMNLAIRVLLQQQYTQNITTESTKKHASFHDANLVVDGSTGIVIITTCSAINDDKVVIMTTLVSSD